jgi:hypothetical protein
MSTSTKEKSVMVGFKLKGKYFKELSARADRAGRSHHAQAQRIVESVLKNAEEEALMMRGELNKLRAEVAAIQANLVTMFAHLVARNSNGKTTIEVARAEAEKIFAAKDGR